MKDFLLTLGLKISLLYRDLYIFYLIKCSVNYILKVQIFLLQPKAHIIKENIFENDSISGTPITYKAPPAAPPKPNWPPPPHQDQFRSPAPGSPTGMRAGSVWPPKVKIHFICLTPFDLRVFCNVHAKVCLQEFFSRKTFHYYYVQYPQVIVLGYQICLFCPSL